MMLLLTTVLSLPSWTVTRPHPYVDEMCDQSERGYGGAGHPSRARPTCLKCFVMYPNSHLRNVFVCQHGKSRDIIVTTLKVAGHMRSHHSPVTQLEPIQIQNK